MKHLTVLLDPGRLKRWVGPNRTLGPPMQAGLEYTLAVGAGMVDVFGRPLRESFYKTFRVSAAVRERIAVEQWEILPPAAKSHQPLDLVFPRPLDWAQLRQAISITSDSSRPVDGRIAIDRGERRWSFTPVLPWHPSEYRIRIASDLEDVCGNDLSGAFDRPLRSAGELASEAASHLITFRVS